MSIRSTISLAAALTLGAATACPAEKAKLPKIDFHRICREIDAATRSSYRNSPARDTINSCIAAETDARDQIVKEWSNFPALARSRCIQPNAYMPTYVRWLTCLELTALKMRKD